MFLKLRSKEKEQTKQTNFEFRWSTGLILFSWLFYFGFSGEFNWLTFEETEISFVSKLVSVYFLCSLLFREDILSSISYSKVFCFLYNK